MEVFMTGAISGSLLEYIITLGKEELAMSGAVTGSALEYILSAEEKEKTMGGVVVGSSMKNILRDKKKWAAVMINTACNQNCPACYLGKKSTNVTMLKNVAEKLAKYARENFDGIAVIGTEPLLDCWSIEIIEIFSNSLRTHVMTNGVNLHAFMNRNVHRIDISLDGGPKTYRRDAEFRVIVQNARRWKKWSGNELYALHMLTRENCKESIVQDMLWGSELIGADKTLFSPYVRTIGGSSVQPASIGEITGVLSRFAEENWLLTIDPYHAILEQSSWYEFKDIAKSILPPENLLVVDFDPGDKIVRIDIDGNAHHPFLALHPSIKLPGVKLF
jgi:sulfatase maturation enzyme AslB (radical SAM superfamily)